jgi:hypothetical protein
MKRDGTNLLSACQHGVFSRGGLTVFYRSFRKRSDSLRGSPVPSPIGASTLLKWVACQHNTEGLFVGILLCYPALFIV